MGGGLFLKPVPSTQCTCLDNVQDLRIKPLVYYTQIGPGSLSELPVQFHKEDMLESDFSLRLFYKMQ